MKKIIFSVTVVMVVFLSATAFGQPCPAVDVNLNVDSGAESQAWWMVLLDFLVQISAPLLTAILGVLGAWVVRKLTRRWDDDKQEKALRLTQDFITSGVAFAEEQARKALRSGNPQTKGVEKLQSAMDFVRQRLDSNGIANIAEEELIHLIEARLHEERSKPDGVVASDMLITTNSDK